METDLLSEQTIIYIKFKKLQRYYHLMVHGPKVKEPTGLSQASNTW